MTTVYLGTHWVSDVLLGWAAGLLILLALPWCEPAMAVAEDYLVAFWARLRTSASQTPAHLPPVGTSAPRPQLVAQRAAASQPHHPGRPHSARHERTPVTPAGSRRPPVERAARPAPVGQPSARGRGPVS
jgi:hypothetical protein